MLWLQVRIFSRNCDEHTSAFPDVVAAVLAAVDPQQLPVVLDAELVAVDRADGNRLRAFQELATRRRGSSAPSTTGAAGAASAGAAAAGAAGSRKATGGSGGGSAAGRGAKRSAAAALGSTEGSSGGRRKVQLQQKLQLAAAAPSSSSLPQSSTATDGAATGTAGDLDAAATHEQQEQEGSTGLVGAAGKVGQTGQVDVCVFVFDALCVAGRDLMAHSLRHRRAAAAAALTHLTPGVVQLAQGIEVQVLRDRAATTGGGAAAGMTGPEAGPELLAAAAAKAAAVDSSSLDAAAAAESSGSWAAAEQQLTEFLFTSLEAGSEGLMLKLLDGPGEAYKHTSVDC